MFYSVLSSMAATSHMWWLSTRNVALGKALSARLRRQDFVLWGGRELWEMSKQRNVWWEQRGFMLLCAYWSDCYHWLIMTFWVVDTGLSSCTVSFNSHVQFYEGDVLQREKLKLSDSKSHVVSEWQRNLNPNLSYSKASKHYAVLTLRKLSCYQDI